MDGILIIRKEKGFTSHDVVAKLRGILRQKKIGHTGTLDPEAEGVLPVCLGRATRVVELLTDQDKTYETVLRLGVVTDTQDMTGKILKTHPVQVTQQQVAETVAGFLGTQMQVPPMYSALKVQGKKLYELAREGITVERSPRQVQFHQIRILQMDLPLVKLSVTCSKGTYIRTLCHDIGQRLGCGGSMEALVRTRVGSFSLEDAYTLEQVQKAAEEEQVQKLLIGIEEIFREYPRVLCKPQGDRLLHNGNPLGTGLVCGAVTLVPVRMCDSSGNFVGIFRYREEQKMYFPVKMFY